ncbi:type I secretion C-terminal target domain-containing protein, partial [Aeromonas rivipollensis]
LLLPLDHSAPVSPVTSDEDDIPLSFGYTVKDDDGSTATGSLGITIDDDSPTVDLLPNIGASVVEGATYNGTWSSGYGADGAGSTKVLVGANEYDLNTDIALASGTLRVNSDGTWRFQAANGLDQDVVNSQSFSVRVRDYDQDTVTDNITIAITDAATPTGGTASNTVDEEGLSNGIIGGPNDATGANTTVTGTLGYNFGGDGAASTGAFTWSTAGLPGLSSGGTALVYSVSADGLTLTGAKTGGGATVFTVKVTDLATGAYEFKLLLPLDHSAPVSPVTSDEDDIPLSFGYTVKDDDGSTATGSLGITIDDDSPIAMPATNAGQATQVQNTNLMLILDISGSMGDPSGYQGMTRMQVMQKSALELLDKYDAYGNVMVNIITFATSAANATGVWVTVDAAKTIILGLSPTNSTNYDDALNEAIKAFSDSGRLVGAQNVSYFMSDGLPNANSLSGGDASVPDGDNSLGGGDGIDGDGATLSGETKDWADFLTANNINSFALGMGSGATQSALNPIAYNGVSGASPANTTAVVVTDFSQLAATLLSTVVAPPLSGQLIDGITASTGADGGWINAITVAGVTYTYNQKTNTSGVSGGTSAGTFIPGTHEWSITVAGGIFKVDMDNGVYTYTPPSSIPVGGINQSFGYSVIDNDGDTASSTLSIIVNPAVGPTVVRDDFIITNQDPSTIPDWALLVNDTGPLAATQTITGVSGAVSGTVTDNAGSVTFDDTSGNITPSTYQGSFNYTNSTTTDTAKVFVDVQGSTLTGSYLDEILIGGSGDETLNGNAGNDILLGGGGIDTLNGGDGNDILVGGTGSDTLTGGGGKDTFKWQAGDAGGTDIIKDFTTGANGDVLDLSELLSGEHANAATLDQYLTFVSSGPGTNKSTLTIDLDGSGSGSSTHSIFFDNVDLTANSTRTDLQIIQDLLNQGNLKVDP